MFKLKHQLKRIGWAGSPVQQAVLAEKLRDPHEQDLSIYWDEQFAKLLEHWDEGNAWHEIKFLTACLHGKVLDIACGTGKTIEIVNVNPLINVFGCDISEFLIQKAIDRGISVEQLKVCDATKTDYPDNFFDYSYSVGSLEHFTYEGILAFVSECARITRGTSFHLVPISRDGQNHGWIKRTQSYYNNSVVWWLEIFRTAYDTVNTIDSLWTDDISLGKWFVCVKSPAMLQTK